MKVLPFKISKPDSTALVYQEDKGAAFYDKFHQHQEIQLSHIIQGEGTLLIGDSVHHYQSGDFLFLGANVPHVFKSEVNPEQETMMVSLFFEADAFGSKFFELDEFLSLQSLLERSKFGLNIRSNQSTLQPLFLALKKADNLERFILCIKILQAMAKSKMTNLSSFIYPKDYSEPAGKRMSDIFEYTMQQFTEEISLDQIAKVAYMTPNAFCKYFKQRTDKTYFQFLTELRIAFACKLLRKHKDLSVVQVADQSGFATISNFNRQFKRLQKMTPLQYRAT